MDTIGNAVFVCRSGTYGNHAWDGRQHFNNRRIPTSDTEPVSSLWTWAYQAGDPETRPLAPAVGIFGPVSPEGYQERSGTSAASALAAGGAAQLLQWAIEYGNRPNISAAGLKAVSYTHLDVYKRQVPIRHRFRDDPFL